MKNETRLAAVFILLPAFALASDPILPPLTTPGSDAKSAPAAAGRSGQLPSQLQALNQMIATVKSDLDKTQQCFETEAALQADLKRKKAQLDAEFKGAVPIAFNDMLWQKSSRAARQHKTCFQLYEGVGKQFEEVDTFFANSIGVRKQQREIIEADKERFAQMAPVPRRFSKTYKPKQGVR